MDSSLLIARILYIVMWIAFIFILAVFISYVLNYFIIDITNYTVSSEKIPMAFNNYKILQLSDLHNDSFGKNNSKLLKKVKEINPDIIVMTGDMISTNSKNYENFYSLAKELVKHHTTYYIMGNHEMRLPIKKQIEIMGQLNNIGVKVLNNSQTTIFKDNESIELYGLHQPITSYKNFLKGNTEIDFNIINMQQIFPIINNESYNILLSHSPFDFDVFSEWGADLVLSGHIHGGTIRLPFIGGLLSPERTFFPKYDAGEYEIGSSKMILSRGLGDGTIKLRVFNHPEICVITLQSAN